MMEQSFQQQSEQFNIRKLFGTFKVKKYRNRVLQLQEELVDLDEEYEIRTPTTIASEMTSGGVTDGFAGSTGYNDLDAAAKADMRPPGPPQVNI